MVEMSWLTDLLPILFLHWKGRIKCPTWRSFTLKELLHRFGWKVKPFFKDFFLKGNGVISTSSSWGQLAWSFQGHCSTSKWAKRGPWKKQRILFWGRVIESLYMKVSQFFTKGSIEMSPGQKLWSSWKGFVWWKGVARNIKVSRYTPFPDMAIFTERCGGSFGVEVFLVRCTYWIYPHLVAVTNKGLITGIP